MSQNEVYRLSRLGIMKFYKNLIKISFPKKNKSFFWIKKFFFIIIQE